MITLRKPKFPCVKARARCLYDNHHNLWLMPLLEVAYRHRGSSVLELLHDEQENRNTIRNDEGIRSTTKTSPENTTQPPLARTPCGDGCQEQKALGKHLAAEIATKNLPSLQCPFLSILRIHLRQVSRQRSLKISFRLQEVLLEEQISDRQSHLHPYWRCAALGNELHSHWDQERPVLCQLPWQQHSLMDL